MRLTMGIPEAQMAEAPGVLRLMRMAPACRVEADEEGPIYVAVFDDILRSIDLVVRLVEAVLDLRGVKIAVEARPVLSLTKFHNALLCYRESTDAPDVEAYCAAQAATVGDAGGCPDRTCLSHCQFICSRCLGVARERGAPPISVQLRKIACQAEVDWCPNLRILKTNGERA